MSLTWEGFFINLVYAHIPFASMSAALWPFRCTHVLKQRYIAATSVLERPDKIIHIQAYLLLAMHAMHWSSMERIIPLASTTVQYRVRQQLQLFETEPVAYDPIVRLRNHIRRRCFWCAYKVDRPVMATFDLSPSIPDAMITTNSFANINDEDLLQVAFDIPVKYQLLDSPSYTCVSSALDILQC
jgi:hypothetical protein